MTLLLTLAAFQAGLALPLATAERCAAGTCAAGSLDLSSSSLDVASWSWGASNPSSRDAGSGLATGRRQQQPRGKVSLSDLSMTRAACSASAPCPAGGTVTVQMAASRKGWDGCVKGNHIADAHLRSSSSSVHLHHLTVEACDLSAGTMTLSYASAVSSPPVSR